MKTADRIIVALDVPGHDRALDLVDQLMPEVLQFKVGMELFYSEGTPLIDEIHQRGARVFLDLKLHDIPNTVNGAARVLAGTGVWMINLHAAGGPEMMRAAREALPDSKLLAVTVLTSLDQQLANEFWKTDENIDAIVSRWAEEAEKAGLDGVVCSPREITHVRQKTSRDFLVVTPGIRPTWSVKDDDQRRITTPRAAVNDGADHLVIGRPITGTCDPVGAVQRIKQELEGETDER